MNLGNVRVFFNKLDDVGGAGRILDDVVANKLTTQADEAVFWSGIGRGGDKQAASWAAKNGGETLETTLANRNIELPRWDPNNQSTIDAWRQVSVDFANGSSGNIRVLQGDSLRINAIFKEEFIVLIANLSVKSITAIDIKTGAEVLLWLR